MDIPITYGAERDARQVDCVKEGQVLPPFRDVEQARRHENGTDDGISQHQNLAVHLCRSIAFAGQDMRWSELMLKRSQAGQRHESRLEDVNEMLS